VSRGRYDELVSEYRTNKANELTNDGTNAASRR
jgi:hypothetical protein